jgi:hypothetical protein
MRTVNYKKTKHVVERLIETSQGHRLIVKYIRKHKNDDNIPHTVRFSIKLAPLNHLIYDIYGKTKVREKFRKMKVERI